MTHPIGMAIVALTTGLLTACGGTDDGPPALLSVSAPTMALAVSGTARMVTVTNLGPEQAEALTTSATGLPTGSWMRSTCPTQLMPGASCLVLVTPGAFPSSTPGDLAPVPVPLAVSGNNTNALTVAVSVLTHGNVHQGGYVFGLDDRTPVTGSVGGKVLTTRDEEGAVWSPSNTAVAGVNDDSTAAQGGCNGALDGRCNTARILAQYPTDHRNFAAARCADSRQGGFDDWYLPAVCELGYDPGVTPVPLCGTQAAPRLPDNATSRLYDQGPIGGFAVGYWSSTQSSQDPVNDARYMVFGLDNPNAVTHKQLGTLPIKCARAMTP